MTPAERAKAGRIGAYISWGNTADRTKRTAPARSKFDARFDQMVIERHGELPPAEHAKCAEAYRKAYFLELAQRSVRARAKRTPNSK